MRTSILPYVVGGAICLTLLFPCVVAAQEGGTFDVQSIYFEGIELKESGRCDFALGRFQLCLQMDPTLHQARLHMAECFHELGMDDRAVTEAVGYLQVGFEEAEEERARKLIVTCGGDPVALGVGAVEAVTEAEAETETETVAEAVTEAEAEAETETETVAESETVVSSPPIVGPRITASGDWTKARVGFGLLLSHYGNDVGLTGLGPLLEFRFRPERYIEFGFRTRLLMGPYPDHDGGIILPEFGFCAAAAIPLGRASLVGGIVIPIVLSGYGGDTRADGGILGEIGVHVPVPGTRLVLGGNFEGGYVVRPTVGGAFRAAIQLGPMREN